MPGLQMPICSGQARLPLKSFKVCFGFAMPNSYLLPSLLYKINENQLALEAAILELSNWIEQRGAADVAENVHGALNTIDKNEEFIKLTLALLMSPD